jgi:hypothetical protein
VPVASLRPASGTRWLLQRNTWASEHVQRLETAAREGGRVSPLSILTKSCAAAELEEARRDASRLGRVTHDVLEQWEPDMPAATVRALLDDICDLHEARDLLDDIGGFLQRAQAATTLGVWWNLGRLVGRGVPMQVRVGSRLVEARQDVLIETPEGIACIDYTVRSHARADARKEAHVQALHGAVILQSGRKLARVGTLYLADGVWQELVQPQDSSRAFLTRLSGDRPVD